MFEILRSGNEWEAMHRLQRALQRRLFQHRPRPGSGASDRRDLAQSAGPTSLHIKNAISEAARRL